MTETVICVLFFLIAVFLNCVICRQRLKIPVLIILLLKKLKWLFVSIITLFNVLNSTSAYICVSSTDRSPFGVKWTQLNQKLPNKIRSTSCAIYESSLYSIGDSYGANISILSTNYLNNIANDRSLWDITQWQADTEYGSISKIISFESFTIVDNKMYIVDARYTNGKMLIYNMESQTQVSGSEYNYQIPISAEWFIPCMYTRCTRCLLYINVLCTF